MSENKQGQKPQTSNAPRADSSEGSSANVPTLAGGQSLEQVREILFGAQTRDLEQRVNALQARMTEGLEGLERSFREQIQKLGERLDARQAELAKSAEAARERADVSATQTRESMAEASRREAAARDELRAEMLRHAGELNLRCDGVARRALADVDQLRSELVDRATLCSVLSEAALRMGAPAPGTAMEQMEQDEGMDALLEARIAAEQTAAGSGTTRPGGKNSSSGKR